MGEIAKQYRDTWPPTRPARERERDRTETTEYGESGRQSDERARRWSLLRE